MQPRISMVTLGVANLEAAIAFYRDGLGLPQRESPPDVAFFTLNGTWLGLYGREALAADANVSAEGSGFSGFTLAHNVGSEEDVDAVLSMAQKAGATVVKPGQKVFWGGYSGYFRDLDGYLWEVAHNPLSGLGHPTAAPESSSLMRQPPCGHWQSFLTSKVPKLEPSNNRMKVLGSALIPS